jgi:hypothetical protein
MPLPLEVGIAMGLAQEVFRQRRRSGLTCALVAVPLLGAVTAAQAQQVGATTVVRNEVARIKGAVRNAIAVGESVFRDEAIQTGADSAAKVVFLDQTNLSIGPNARVALNQYVYSEARPAGKVALNLLRGTYRFVTGDLDKRAYEINTPVATIGVRGTEFDVATTGARTVVTLLGGEVRVCTRSASPQCLTMNQPGQVAIVTAGGVRLAPPGSSDGGANFAAYCAGGAGLCDITRVAFNGTGAAPVEVASLCGR